MSWHDGCNEEGGPYTSARTRQGDTPRLRGVGATADTHQWRKSADASRDVIGPTALCSGVIVTVYEVRIALRGAHSSGRLYRGDRLPSHYLVRGEMIHVAPLFRSRLWVSSWGCPPGFYRSVCLSQAGGRWQVDPYYERPSVCQRETSRAHDGRAFRAQSAVRAHD